MNLCPDLLSAGYEYILTEKLLCQDPVEQYFSQQRNATGSNNAPTMAEFLNYNRLHSVAKSAATSLQGNCSTGPKSKAITVTNEPVPKRKRKTVTRLDL